jgi:signal transduction histidine kinase/CheY-like chemotaxis protein
MTLNADGVAPSDSDESGLTQLRRETVELLSTGLVGLVLGLLGLAAIDSETRQPLIVVVILPILLGAGVATLREQRLIVSSSGMIGALGLSIVAADLVYPNHQLLYAFALLAVIANILLGDLAGFGVAAVASVIVLHLSNHGQSASLAVDNGTALFLIWTAAILSWLASRPTRTALNWSWRSYLLARERTEELRDRQGELIRLAKSLNEACYRLEQMNQELERARRAAEDARRLKASFAATISHELRTPLNLIIGFSEMMMNAPQAYAGLPLPGCYRLDLEAIYRNASQISRLIDDVLDLSQIDAHRLALDRTKVPLVQIVADAASTVALLFDHLGLSLSIDLPPDLPLLNVDANRIRQILINLLSNAARFTAQGGVTIRARCTGSEVVVAVADTGEGIAPSDVPHVFDEFHQAGLSGRRRDGSGLGLAVCKRFAEMHGGYMWAESSMGIGSSFYLALPVGENVVTTSVVLGASRPLPEERTVLVIDRDGDTARILQRYLDGYQVVPAATIGELSSLETHRPVHALVFADQTEADMWRQRSKSGEDLRRLPTFTCSISTPRALAEELGVLEYLVKPVSRSRVLASLRRVGKDVRDVLIVEDDLEMSRLLSSFVRTRSRRCRVSQVADGAEALARLRERRPDLVLLDLLIPGTSGYEVLRQMRADPALRDVPIVVISGKGDHDEAIVASTLSVSRAEGLTVGELMKCLRGSLDALLNRAPPDSVPAQPGDFAA